MVTKTQFLKHAIVFGFGSTLVQLAPVILLPLYTNYLTTAEYGFLNLIDISAVIIDTVFFSSGIRLAAMTFFKQAENEEARKHIAVTVVSMLGIALAAGILFLLVSISYLELFLKTGNPPLLLFGIITALLEGLVSVPKTLMQARLESGKFVFVNICTMLLRVGLCVYFVAGLHWGAWGVLYAQFIVCVLFSIILNVREWIIGSFIPDVSKWKEIFWFSLPLLPNGMLSMVYTFADRFILLSFSPYTAAGTAMNYVGLFALGYRLTTFTSFLGTSALRQVWQAEMYEVYQRSDAGYSFGNVALRLLVVRSFGLLALCCFSGEIVRMICDPSYYEAVPIVPLFAAAMFFDTLSQQIYDLYFITRTTYRLIYCNLVMIPCVLLFTAGLIPIWGLTGAAAAYVLGRLTMCVLGYFLTQTVFHVYYPFRKMLLLAGITAAVVTVNMLFGNAVSAEDLAGLTKWKRLETVFLHIDWLLVAVKSGLLILWCAVVWYCGIVLQDDKKFAAELGKKLLRKLGMNS